MKESTTTSLPMPLATRPKPKIKRWESPIAGYLFISPWLIGFLGLTLYPIVQSLYYSFTDFSLLEEPNWVGFKNYNQILTSDDRFIQAVKVTFLYVVASTPIKLIAALFVAILLAKSIKGMSAYRTAIYFPSLIGGSIAVSILWKNIFGKEGFINNILAMFGIEGTGWVTNPDTALWTLILLVGWQFGSAMVIFLAGLKQIPIDLYEASSVDGAGKMRQFFNITLPMLSPTLYFNTVMGIIGAFQMFTPAMIITNGGPANSTYIYSLYLYERAFSRLQMGYASGLAWIMLLIIVASTALIFLTSKYWVFYENEGGKSR
ncbi:carbohydrate ABC transporter permease [Paenibacillus agricola]|uniref:Sugar ABC transporter permease n=1 Tax=Paenibacillus agricola TaxID=2716264 RepID=A0ABX0JCB1_9BACL|nr:sugar ABC transporter permease [Paenibacillus agricola]NHN34064.1 sugar ABC transporter permease [Paenibacillus agricola]